MPADRAEYRLSPEAERDMEGIWLYSLEKWGFEQANRYRHASTSGDTGKRLGCQGAHKEKAELRASSTETVHDLISTFNEHRFFGPYFGIDGLGSPNGAYAHRQVARRQVD